METELSGVLVGAAGLTAEGREDWGVWGMGWGDGRPRVRPRPAPAPRGRRGWGLAAMHRLRREGVVRGEAAASMQWREMLRELSERRDGGVASALGIDLAARGHEVRKLFYAGGYHRSALREGIDPEEALQEVFRGLLIRNGGRCPWDAKKSSFGHYVHLVIGCVMSNYLRKERRRGQREFLAGVDEDGETRVTDGVTPGHEGDDEFTRRQLVGAVVGAEELELALRMIRGLEAGRPRREIAAELGRSVSWVEETLRRLRRGLSAGES